MNDLYLMHHGTLGMHWGVRRYQNSDGSLTEAGKRRYLNSDGSVNKAGIKFYKKQEKAYLKEEKKAVKRAYKEDKKQAKIDKMKEKVFEKNDLKTAYKKRKYFTKEEIDRLVNKKVSEDKLAEYVNGGSKDVKTKSGYEALKKVADETAFWTGKVSNIANNVANAANSGTNIYNIFAKTSNSILGTNYKKIGDEARDKIKIAKTFTDGFLEQEIKTVNSSNGDIEIITRKHTKPDNTMNVNSSITNPGSASSPQSTTNAGTKSGITGIRSTNKSYDYIDKYDVNGKTIYVYDEDKNNKY